MAVRLAAALSIALSDVAYGFIAARTVFNLPALWQRIDSLDGAVGGEAQLRLYEATQELVNTQTQWFLREGGVFTDLSGTIAGHEAGLSAFVGGLDTVLPPGRRAQLDRRAIRLCESGIPTELARDVARLAVLGEAPGITEIAAATGSSVPDAARIHLAIGEQLRIADMFAKSASIGTSDQYDCVAIAQALHRLESAQARFSRAAIAAGGIEAWRAAMGERFAHLQSMLDQVAGEGALTLSRLLVAADQLSELAAAPSASASRVRGGRRTKAAATGTPRARGSARRPRS